MSTQEQWQRKLEQAKAAVETEAYKKFHAEVVEEGVKRTGEDWRKMWEEMSYEMEFVDGETVDETVTGNIEAMEADS